MSNPHEACSALDIQTNRQEPTARSTVHSLHPQVCEYGMPEFSCPVVDGALDCPPGALEPLPDNSRGQLTWLLSEHAKCISLAAAEAFPLAAAGQQLRKDREWKEQGKAG